METLKDIEDFIDVTKKRIALFESKLKEHESGVSRMSAMAKASSETKLDEMLNLLQSYEAKRDELVKIDSEVLKKIEDEARLQELKIYALNQKKRILSNIEISDEIKKEILKTLDELPSNIIFRDEELIDLAEKSLQLNLREVDEHLKTIKKIKIDFDGLFKNIDTSDIKEIDFLNNQILVLTLQFHTFVENLNEAYKDENKKFAGLPKYEDWWIDEMWFSHLAYFSLLKWKKIIKKFCLTKLQKKSWNIIFANWVSIKDVVNGFGEKGYEYQFAFDSLILKYAQLNEELVDKNLENIEKFMTQETKKEDFSIKYAKHNRTTSYLLYKRERLKGLS
ncbi:hypothetical protein [Arcobacter sp. FWKO B]|uniref:hypothetical protein n=1 Tax=Arcobacter sp. FWKO B TaxID=2593672 RepID=UPI0018A5E04B|nr:hypothetical protein [Arcobacter sp. FWKO B]QOG11197.1 hypothetical protein FWKOB_00185 [Arcobacter sp. FWKO B]